MKAMRRALGVLAAMALLGGLGQMPAAMAGPRVLLNGREVQLRQPLMRQGTVLLIWVRDAERVGLGALGQGAAGAVTLTKGRVTIAFQKGSDQAAVGGEVKTMPAPALIVEGRMMVPVEFVCEAFDVSLRIGRVAVVPSPDRGGGPRVRLGTIVGRVTYGGAPAAGIRVRLVWANDRSFVRGAVSVTGSDGRYLFAQVPDGDYHAFVYVGDNPDYFNRQSAAVHMAVPARVEAEEIRVGRVLRPVRPQPGAEVRARLGKVRLAWRPCPQAASYRITIKRASDGTALFATSSLGPSCSVPADRLEEDEPLIWSVVASDVAGEFLGGSPGAGGTPWTFSLTSS